ncbi:MAG: sulfurtransferase TusA family protein, partial [Mailhella sp.]|nr:sulfurtransferase TusA family protein [Mailhella sp.]
MKQIPVVDCRGLVCPEPVIRTRDALSEKPEKLTVLVDYAPS